MFIKKLRLKNFRNFDDQQLSFHHHTNIFVGNNGQGKTNLVESICFLSKGKSFRTHQTDVLIANTKLEEGSKIECLLDKQGTDIQLSAYLREHKKELLINEKRTNSLKSFKTMPVIIFSPESLLVLKEGPEERRNLIDETSIMENESHISRISDFRKILKTKNMVLKRFKSGQMSSAQAEDLLMSLQPIFIEKSCEIIHMRTRTMKETSPFLKEIYSKITGQSVDISVAYVAKEELGPQLAEDVCNTLRKDLAEKWQIEMNSGLSLYGPHKHDSVFMFEGRDSRHYCSQGQQRALILAFKFTQILYHRLIYGYYPILILDDVLSELDREKRSFLIDFLNNNEAQTFLTTTDLDTLKNSGSGSVAEKNVCVFNVENGAIKDSWS